MVSLKKLVVYACVPFLFGVFHHALQTQGSGISENHDLQIPHADDDQPIDTLERFDMTLSPNIVDDSENVITLGDQALVDTPLKEQKDTETKNAQEQADKMGITFEEYKTFQGLLKTADIDLGDMDKSEGQLKRNTSSEEQVDESETSREERSSDDICPGSPEGQGNCIPCKSDGKTKFQHTDGNGFTCQCEMCMKPTYMETPCTCTAEGGVKSGPTCAFPDPGLGFFMPYRNWCSVPFTCKATCPGDMIIVKSCTVATDAECGCPDNTDQTGEASCRPIPRCDAGYESRKGGSLTGYLVHICKPCLEGFIQPKNNTLDNCRPAPPLPPKDDHVSPEPKLETGTPKPNQDHITGESVHNASSGTNLLPDNTSTPSPVNSTTSSETSGNSIHLMDRWSLAVIWTFSIIIAILMGYLIGRVGISAILFEYPRKLYQRCNCFNKRQYQLASSNNNDANKDVSIDMEQDMPATTPRSNQSVVTFSADTGRTETDLVLKSSPKMTPRRRKGRRNKTI